MFKDLIYLFLLVILWAVDSFAVVCTEYQEFYSTVARPCGYGSGNISNSGVCAYNGSDCGQIKRPYQSSNYNCMCTGSSNDCMRVPLGQCTTGLSGDSLMCLYNGNLWIDGDCRNEQWVCENDGGTWNDQTQSCTPPCNDHANPHQECVQSWDNGYNECEGLNCVSGGYWKINIYECYFDSCAMSKVCSEGSSFPGMI